MTRRAKRPLDPAAVLLADAAYYAAHPEMIDDRGNRIPIPAEAGDPCSKLMAEDWLDAYVANGGHEDRIPFPPKKVGGVVTYCPAATVVLTPAAADAIFNELAANDNTPFDYPVDCCYSRAHSMCRTLKDQCIESRKVWYFVKGFGTPSAKPDLQPTKPSGSAVMFPDDRTGTNQPVQWVYHVAPIVKVAQPSEPPQDMVLDPSLATGPITIDEWKKVQGTPAGAYEEISDSDAYFQNQAKGWREDDPDLRKACSQMQKHQRDRDARRWLAKMNKAP